MSEKLLQIQGLKTHFKTESGIAEAVDGVNLDIFAGEVLGLVGESGAGKSVTALSILRLIPNPPGEIVAGSILFRGQDLLKVSWQEMRKIRGKEISMIFQEPMTSLNPVFTVGMQLSEVVLEHEGCSKQEAFDRGVEMLKLVGIPEPALRMSEYPHQFSGGMRQRVMIAMALACNPSLLIADEPTTALDVTIQSQILELMLGIKEQRKDAAILLITHNLAVVAETLRPRGGDVWRPDSGDCSGYRTVQKPTASLYPRAAGLFTQPGWRESRAASSHPRKCPKYSGSAGGLQICDPMSGKA